MVEEHNIQADGPLESGNPPPARRRRRPTRRESAPAAEAAGDRTADETTKPTRRRRAPKRDVAPVSETDSGPPAEATTPLSSVDGRERETVAEPSDSEPAPSRRRRRRPAAAPVEAETSPPDASEPTAVEQAPPQESAPDEGQAPAPPRRRRRRPAAARPEAEAPPPDTAEPAVDQVSQLSPSADEVQAAPRRRRRGHRGGVGRRRQTAEQAVAGIPPVPEPVAELEPELPAETPLEPHGEEQPSRRRPRRRVPKTLEALDTGPSISSEISFMHPSEREFANLLDYYQIKYLYEPRSFPLRWDGNRVVEMHTPDFYLPEYDQYFELTTMKQNLVTQKNRKLRHVHELYPEVNIQLLYRRDLMRLMGKYGFGPLAEVDVKGTEQVLFTEEQVQQRVRELGEQITRDYEGQEPVLIGVLRGVVVFMADLMRHIDLPLQIEFMEISHYGEEREEDIEVLRDTTTELRGRPVVVIEDIVDTGLTLRYLLEHLKAKKPSSVKVCALLDKSVRRMARVPLDYVGFEIPDEFVIGYGLDYGGRYRNLPYIGVLKPAEPKAIPQR